MFIWIVRKRIWEGIGYFYFLVILIFDFVLFLIVIRNLLSRENIIFLFLYDCFIVVIFFFCKM